MLLSSSNAGILYTLILWFTVALSMDVTVNVDWNTVVKRTATAATIEVDVMPFLGRTEFGGSFNAYYEAMANLGAEYVRYAPWYPNPRVVVPELTPHICTKTQRSSNWNSTMFDGIMRDFMAAVCGPDAVRGECKLSVVQQLSTMPSWMYVGGYCQDAAESCLPLAGQGAWNTTNPFNAYARGGALVDPSCGEMARYMARLVGWYTSGGFNDECGHWHESGLHYNWWGLSVLNEDEHSIQPDDGTAYTTCYDAIAAEVSKVNPTIQLVGPEIAGTSGHSTEYLLHFLNASNHNPPIPPAVSSYHWGSNAGSGPDGRGSGGEGFLAAWESTVTDPASTPMRAEAFKLQTGQATEMVLNEFIPFVTDWCDPTHTLVLANGGSCPNWQDPATAGGDPDLRKAKGLGINRRTWSWNAAAAVFAYGYGTLAELGYKYVGQDQLIGGTWPDNEPAVSCMDWQTGEVNAKYWVTNLLATTIGTKEEKSLLASNVTALAPPAPPVGTTGHGTCGVTGYGKQCSAAASGAYNTTIEGIRTLDDCKAKVAACANGNYVSFSLSNEDCSWYAHCDMDSLTTVRAGYISEAVTGKDKTDSPVYALAYNKAGKNGLLLVNKKAVAQKVTVAGASGGVASVIEVATAGPNAEEPAFAPQIVKQLSNTGELELGPFAVAVLADLN